VEQNRPVDGHAHDETLVELVARRDVDAFDLLYDRYARVVHGMAIVMLGRSEAEEAVQEVFLRLWARAGQYDSKRGLFRPWFMTLARNHILNLLRARGPERRTTMVDDIEQLLAGQPDPAVDLEASTADGERQREMLQALRALPEEQRRVLIMAYFGGLSQSVIARQLSLPLGTVKKRTRLGLRKLRAILEEQEAASEAPDPDKDKVVRS
jgi:RNA polymerase sigma-70 factor (ECF subfamily)